MKINSNIMTIVVIIWSLSIVSGLMWMADYASHPIDPEDFPTPMPAGVLYTNSSGQQPKFVVFSHPNCSCTRTTLQQLARLISRYQTPIQVSFLFNKPANPDQEQIKSEPDAKNLLDLKEKDNEEKSENSAMKSNNQLIFATSDFSCEFTPASKKLIQVSNQ